MKIIDKIKLWWNSISYIDVKIKNTNYIFRFLRKNIAIGYETENIKSVNLYDIKYAKNIKNIYPRLALFNINESVLYIFNDNKFKKIGSHFNDGFYQRLFSYSDIEEIICYSKRHLFKRNYKILNIPWKEQKLKNNIIVNKEQATQFIDQNNIEIRWGKESISIFDNSNENYITYKDINKGFKYVKYSRY